MDKRLRDAVDEIGQDPRWAEVDDMAVCACVAMEGVSSSV